MDWSKINIESVTIGALIGLCIKSVFDRINVALKLNRQRKVIVDYAKFIGVDKSRKFIEDLDYINRYILAETEEEILRIREMNYAIDAMPMFTSSIYKGFSQDELRRISLSSSNYIRILDVTFSIDFLRDYMPLQLWEKYRLEVRAHMEEKKIPPSEEVLHFQECGYLKSLSASATNEIEMKRQRAIVTCDQFIHIIERLGGYNLLWIIKYFVWQ